MDGVLLGDVVVRDKCFEAVVNGVTAFLSCDFHEAYDLLDLTFAEAGLDPRIYAKSFCCKNTSPGVGSWEKSLTDDGLENIGKLGSDLNLLVRREKVHDTFHRFWGVDGVEGAYDKVSGFGGGHRDLHGLAVAEFSDDDDIRILAHALAKAE